MILAESAVRDLARELEAIVGGDNLIVDDDARPGTLAELAAVLAVGVRRRVPVTARGAGTGNYGQSLPLERGILIDIRRLNRIVAVNDAAITLEAGVVLEDAERAA